MIHAADVARYHVSDTQSEALVCRTDALVGPSHSIAGVSDPLFQHTVRKNVTVCYLFVSPS